MNLIYAALLLHSAKKEISEAHVKKVAEAAGASVEEAQVKALVSALEGVNIDEAITKAAMPVAVAAAPAASAEAHVEKHEEKAEDTEKKAEEAAAGLSSLFG
jgi:large subunit ribosomal protein L12